MSGLQGQEGSSYHHMKNSLWSSLKISLARNLRIVMKMSQPSRQKQIDQTTKHSLQQKTFQLKRPEQNTETTTQVE